MKIQIEGAKFINDKWEVFGIVSDKSIFEVWEITFDKENIHMKTELSKDLKEKIVEVVDSNSKYIEAGMVPELERHEVQYMFIGKG